VTAALAGPASSGAGEPAGQVAFPVIPPGTWLEIEGDLAEPGRMRADEIEVRQAMAEIRISDEVRNLDDEYGTFFLLGFPCRLSADTRFRDEEGNDATRARFAEGAWVQVRATYEDDGVFDVERVEYLDDPEREIQAPVVSTETTGAEMVIRLRGLLVVVDDETEFQGDWSQPLPADPPTYSERSQESGHPLAFLGPLAPYRWGGELSLAYEDRESEDAAGNPTTGTGNPTFWFAETEDVIGAGGIWLQWKLRPFSQSTRIELGYYREQWIEGEILSRDRFELELRQGLSPRSRLELEVEYSPQIYVTHRRDRDATSGEPVFRPDAYREIDLELKLERELASRVEASLFGTYTSRRETQWFRERDRTRPGVGAGIVFPLARALEARSEYEYRVTSSRNEPDLGRDHSYREHVIDFELTGAMVRFPTPLRLIVATRWKLRSYTTDDPEDERRFERSEQIVSWRARLERPSERVTPYVTWETLGRSIDAPGDIDVVLESEDYGRALLRAGLEWEWDLDP
jgi:hypothetical protein